MPNHVYLLRGASEVYPIHIEVSYYLLLWIPNKDPFLDLCQITSEVHTRKIRKNGDNPDVPRKPSSTSRVVTGAVGKPEMRTSVTWHRCR